VHALCTTSDPEIFFPPSDNPATEARQIRTQCPVRGQCLAYAIAADEPSGIWGGLDTQERNLRRRLQRHGTAMTAAAGGTA
jgi:WhiB family redox-sensing transcriptional regulator